MYKSSGSKRLSLRLAWTDENFKSNLDSLTLLWKTAYLEDEVHEEMILAGVKRVEIYIR